MRVFATVDFARVEISKEQHEVTRVFKRKTFPFDFSYQRRVKRISNKKEIYLFDKNFFWTYD